MSTLIYIYIYIYNEFKDKSAIIIFFNLFKNNLIFYIITYCLKFILILIKNELFFQKMQLK